MLKHYVIENLDYLERIRAWVMNPDNHSTLILRTQPPTTQWVLVVNDAPGMQSFSQQAELDLGDLIREVQWPE